MVLLAEGWVVLVKAGQFNKRLVEAPQQLNLGRMGSGLAGVGEGIPDWTIAPAKVWFGQDSCL